jgi:hypothetical protein
VVLTSPLPEQLLHGADVVFGLQEVGSEAAAQRVRRGGLERSLTYHLLEKPQASFDSLRRSRRREKFE